MLFGYSISFLEATAFTLWVSSYFPIEYKYLRYVDLGQAASQFGKFLLMSIGLSVVASLYWYLLESTTGWSSPSVRAFFQAIPHFIWFLIYVGYFTWYLRGHKIEWPHLTFKQWMVLNVAISVSSGVLLFSATYLPEPAWQCTCAALLSGYWMYYRLLEIGKANYQSRTKETDPPLVTLT